MLSPARVNQAGRLHQITSAWLLGKKSANTRTAYRRDLLGDAPRMKVPGWVVWCAAYDLDPLQARRGHVDTYARTLEAAGCSPATVARRLSVIASWYDYLVAEEVAERNPAAAVDRPNVDRDVSHTVGLDETETGQFLAAADESGLRTSALLRLLLYNGLRVGTALGADVGDLGYDRGHRTLKMTFKGGTVRRAPLTAPVCEAIDAYLAERGNPARDEPLFATSTDGRLDEPYVWRLVRRVARQAGIPSANQLSPHSLRHTFATQARDLNVSLEDVQDAMGHQDPRTTRRYDRARHRLDRHPGFALAARFARDDG